MHLIRCNKCQVFGHSAKKCRSKTPKCPHCAGPHTHQQCKNRKNRKCANCGLTTHGAAYAGCSVFRQYKVKIELENIRLKEEWARYVDKVETARNPRHKTPKNQHPPTHSQTHRTDHHQPTKREQTVT